MPTEPPSIPPPTGGSAKPPPDFGGRLEGGDFGGRLEGGERLLSNTGFNVLGLLANTLIALVVTPLLLSYLGSEGFGIWALFGIVLTASQLLDFGLGRALVRNIAHYRAVGRWSAISQDFNSSLWPLGVVLLALTMAGWMLAPGLASWLGVPSAFQTTATPVLRLLMLSLLPVGLGLLLGATLEGAQQMAYTSGALTLNRLLFAGGVVLTVTLDWGLPGVAWAYLLATWLQLLVLALATVRVNPAIRFTPRLMQRASLSRDMRFGMKIMSTALIALAFTATNKIILARWVGLNSVAYFELASVIALQLFALAMAMSRALYPALVAAQAERGRAALRRLFGQALRLLVLGVTPAATLLIALAAPFVGVWLDDASLEAVRSLQWLVGAWSIAAIATAAAVGFAAIGRPGWGTAFSAYNAILNLALALLLTPRWGLWGVVAANVVAVSSSALLTLWFFSRQIEMDGRSLLSVLSPAVLAWASALAVALAWLGWRWTPQRLAGVALLAGVYGLVYAAGLVGFRLLRPEERAWLRRHFNQRGRLSGLAL